MTSLRALSFSHRAWFALLLACTLAMRVLVPAGFMPVVAGGAVAMRICPGVVSDRQMTATMPAMKHGKADGHGKVEMPCAFTGLSLAALGSDAPVMILAAMAFAMARAVHAATRLPIPPIARLRPPLRAPPLAR